MVLEQNFSIFEHCNTKKTLLYTDALWLYIDDFRTRINALPNAVFVNHVAVGMKQRKPIAKTISTKSNTKINLHHKEIVRLFRS